MKIATWNVNSVKARLPHVIDYLREKSPDVILLQETKVVDEAFPALEIDKLGYNVAVHGQKTYNGVAILSKRPIDDVVRGLGGDKLDEQARYIEGTVGTVRVASIYLPNGNPVGTEKFTYKLSWMARLRDRMKELLETEEACVFGGDYNVCPSDIDVLRPFGIRRRCALPVRVQEPFPIHDLSGPDRRLARVPSRTGRLFLLGLPAGRLAQGSRTAYRSPVTDSACSRPSRGC